MKTKLSLVSAFAAISILAGCGGTAPRLSIAPIASESPEPTDEPTPTLPPQASLDVGPTGPTEQVTLVAVEDGDTIIVDLGGVQHEVRYLGMDSPESSDDPFSFFALTTSQQLLSLGPLTLEKDITDADDIGRLLRYVWVRNGDAWVNVSVEMVRLGAGEADRVPPDIKYDANIAAAQVEAQNALAGIWGEPPPPTPTPLETPSPDSSLATPTLAPSTLATPTPTPISL